MVIKCLSGLLVIAVVATGVGGVSGASSFSGSTRQSTAVTCVQSRSGTYCEHEPIVETPDLVFSPDGRSAYHLLSVLPESQEEERSGIWIYDRDPTTGSLIQKPGTAGCISEGRVEGCQPGRAFGGGQSSIRVSSDGRNLYAATYSGLAVFDRDPSSGALTQKEGAEGCISSLRERATPCTPARGLPSTDQVALSPDGRSAYATTPRALVVFDRDPSTGALIQKPGPEGMVLGGAGGNVLVSPDGGNVYVSRYGPDAILTFDRDLGTGVLTRVPKPAGCISEKGESGCRRGHEFSISEMAISPDGRNIYGVGQVVQKVGVVVILDRRPNGTLAQKPGKAGCIGGESRKSCTDPYSQGEVRGITVSPDGKRVYLFEYPQIIGEGGALTRHPSGRLTEAP